MQLSFKETNIKNILQLCGIIATVNDKVPITRNNQSRISYRLKCVSVALAEKRETDESNACRTPTDTAHAGTLSHTHKSVKYMNVYLRKRVCFGEMSYLWSCIIKVFTKIWNSVRKFVHVMRGGVFYVLFIYLARGFYEKTNHSS